MVLRPLQGTCKYAVCSPFSFLHFFYFFSLFTPWLYLVSFSFLCFVVLSSVPLTLFHLHLIFFFFFSLWSLLTHCFLAGFLSYFCSLLISLFSFFNWIANSSLHHNFILIMLFISSQHSVITPLGLWNNQLGADYIKKYSSYQCSRGVGGRQICREKIMGKKCLIYQVTCYHLIPSWSNPLERKTRAFTTSTWLLLV